MIRPLNDKILVKLVVEEEEVKNSIIIKTSAQQSKKELVKGKVLAKAECDCEEECNCSMRHIKAGDIVLFSKYNAVQPKSDVEEYLVDYRSLEGIVE